MDGDASFGHWLRLRRKALRLSCAELARRVGCAIITLHKIEADERRPSEQIAAKLAEQLNIAPHERVTFIKVARGELGVHRLASPDQVVDGPVLAARSPLRTKVPIPLTPLIGRAHEVAAVRDYLLRADVRLLTLIGAPGIGKTHLAMQVATDLHDAFADGVIFIPLAPIRDPELVIPTIAQALEISEAPGQPLLGWLQAHLRARHTLLVLDNFEQVLKAALQLAELLAAAPRLTLLVTSRVALHLSGEQRFVVPPLALPDVRRLTLAADLVSTLADYAAVELFVVRARAAMPTFALTNTNALAVAEICQRLDGLPLAIELAAARIALFAPWELLAQLDQRLALLTTGAVDLPTRQQTLRRAIDWSYELLDQDEQKLFRWLGVFVGGWTLEAARAVCDAADDLGIDVLNGVTALLDKSLLQRDEGADGRSRFTMLETIREYALERLAARGEAGTLRRQHAEYYLVMADAAEPKLHDADQRVWLDRLEAEHDNLRAALEWSLSAQDNLAIGVQLAGTLWSFWHLRGYLSEGRDWLARLLARVQESDAPTSDKARALHGAGALANVQGDYVQALVLCRESLALFRGLEDKRGMAMALDEIGFVAQQQGEIERARAFHEESLALFRELGEKHGIANALYSLGHLARDQGDYKRATTLYQESLSLFREQGDRWGTGIALGSLGMMAWLMGNYAAASALFEQGLVLWQELGHISGIADTLNHLGLVAREQGDYATARALFEQSLALQREQGREDRIALSLHDLGTVARHQGDYERAHALLEESLALVRHLGDKGAIALVLSHLGQLAHAEGDFGRAAGHYDESLRLFSGLGNKAGIAWCLVELAEVCQTQGQPERAVLLLAAAEALLATTDRGLESPVRMDYERSLTVARAQLDEATFAAAWAQGRAMSLDQVVAEALDH